MKLFWLLVIVLAVPILPALLIDATWGLPITTAVESSAEQSSAEHSSAEQSRWGITAVIVGLLAADIFLPTPSGPLATLAGAQLGFLGALMAVWTGLVSGAVIGFWLTRCWGTPLVRRLAGEEQLEQLRKQFGDRTWAMLMATRPLPILAEAAVLAAGVANVSWRQFLPPIALGSFLFAAVLVAMGSFAVEHEMLTIAVALSAILPIAAVASLRRQTNQSSMNKSCSSEDNASG